MKIPKQEQIVMTYIFDGIKHYVITRNVIGKYTLYKLIDDDYQKIKIADTPVKFDEIVERDRSEEDGDSD